MSPAIDPTDYKQYILNFSLPKDSSKNVAYTRVLLQLFGYAGHGKSAFVNSCLYTLRTGEFRTDAKTGSSETIITTKRNSYKLTDTITIVDNRGFGRKTGDEEAVAYAQLGHFLPLDKEVVLPKDFEQIMSQVEDSDLTPNCTDFIVPIFVYSVKNKMPEEQVKEVQTFFRNCKDMTGVTPIVVLTHKSHTNYGDLAENFKQAEAEQVLAIENYTPENHMKTRGRCADIQGVIVNALEDVKFRLQQPRNPVEERLERKKFLLKFVHEFIVKEIKNKAEEEKRKAVRGEFDRLRSLTAKTWFKRFPYDSPPDC